MGAMMFKLTEENLFASLNVVLPCWLLLMFIPTHKLTQASVLLAVFYICVLYTVLLVPLLINTSDPHRLNVADFASLDGVRKVFANRKVQLAAWAHYLAFDLWTGRWVALDGVRRSVPRLLMAPILALNFMLGPMGFALYLLARQPFKLPRGSAARPHYE